MYTVQNLFDLSHTMAKEYLSSFTNPWQALSGIKELIIKLGTNLSKDEYEEISLNVWVHKSATVAPTAFIGAPAIIGKNSVIRHCAFIRGSVLVGENCVVGNSVEVKNALLFDNVQVPHFNYVGDSILGYRAHMGAGSITSNVKSDKTNVTILFEKTRIETGLKKMGAIIGDGVEIGCNSVLNPGTVIGKNSTIYPLSCVRGFIGENSIYKSSSSVIIKEIRE